MYKRQVLKRANLWEKVSRLPLQEKTYLGKDLNTDGIQLSGGEVQRLILARALYTVSYTHLDEPAVFTASGGSLHPGADRAVSHGDADYSGFQLLYFRRQGLQFQAAVS